ncbi:MAG: arsenite methyltransferase [Lysobacterales bacterium]|jgi:SAM-dependent methyltransferase
MSNANDQLRETVRQKYAEIARSAESTCCAPACCGGDQSNDVKYSMIGDAYDGVDGYVAEADLSLGCGLPVEHAGLAAGQTVLDLGSGAGLDVFVARGQVGESGRVIGVDMTAEMIDRARENARAAGFGNVEFRLGEIEHLPVEDASVDVVISNCVLNLVPDKTQAFAEIFRVLKPGGHFCISDIVASTVLPDWVSGIAAAYAGCVTGAIPRSEYLRIIRNAGFRDVEIAAERRVEIPADVVDEWLTAEQKSMAEAADIHVLSVTVRATK